MIRRISGVVYAIVSVGFAIAACYLLYFAIAQRVFLEYALVLVFALGSTVAVKSARESFSGSTTGRVSRS